MSKTLKSTSKEPTSNDKYLSFIKDFIALKSEIAALYEDDNIKRDKTATTKKFSYKYMDLYGLLKILTPLCSKHGIVFMQREIVKDYSPEDVTGEMFVEGVETIITHKDGYTDSFFSKYVDIDLTNNSQDYTNPIQDRGKMQTYFKRYALTSYFGIVAQNEDDNAQGVRISKDSSKTNSKIISEKQLSMLANFAKQGLLSEEDRELMKDKGKSLTTTEASSIIRKYIKSK